MTHFDDLEAQAAALDEECPVCRVPSGTMCVGQVTRETMRATHWQRIPRDLTNDETSLD